jgi:hypothetical protein
MDTNSRRQSIIGVGLALPEEPPIVLLIHGLVVASTYMVPIAEQIAPFAASMPPIFQATEKVISPRGSKPHDKLFSAGEIRAAFRFGSSMKPSKWGVTILFV